MRSRVACTACSSLGPVALLLPAAKMSAPLLCIRCASADVAAPAAQDVPRHLAPGQLEPLPGASCWLSCLGCAALAALPWQELVVLEKRLVRERTHSLLWGDVPRRWALLPVLICARRARARGAS